ncbi:MAG TPA: cytochrome c [Alloacidobacterium sp.]|jgi:mono/diheme cytochrome c family protein|nr:cytochrome c [Alloacidobacterium sp.]
MQRKIMISLAAIVLLAVFACIFLVGQMIHRGFSTREQPGVVESSLATAMRDAAISARYKTMKNPVAVTPEAIQEGMDHWADHCATCHANNGSGDTMYGRTMYPRPPDMRQNDTQRKSDGELYWTIKNGVRLSGMPAFGAPGDDDMDSWKLVAFIRHLPSLSQSEEQGMEKMNPKSPQEMEEEQEEENFLNGSATRSQSQPTHHHGKETP